MGGSPRAHGQDTANSSHQAPTNQPPTSTDSLLPTHSADNTSLKHYHPNISSTGVSEPQNHPSPPAALASARGQSSVELTYNGKGDNVFQNQFEPERTAEVESVGGLSNHKIDGCSSPPVELRCERPCANRLSLFSGMELVAKGRPLCHREMDTTEDSSRENVAVNEGINIGKSVDTPSVASGNSPPVSAFSFLNF